MKERRRSMGVVVVPNWAQRDRSLDTISSEQLGALRVRCWVSVTIATDPHLLYEAFDVIYGEDPCAPRNSDDGLDDAAACAAELMRAHIDTIQADAALRIDAYHQSQVHGDDT